MKSLDLTKLSVRHSFRTVSTFSLKLDSMVGLD